MRKLNLFKNFLLLLLVFVSVNSYPQNLEKSVGIMSYLLPPRSDAEIESFNDLIDKAINIGIKDLSADIWVWQMLKKEGSVFLDDNDQLKLDLAKIDNTQLDFYFKTAKMKDLKLDLIISYHKLGGNVGDEGSVDMPVWAIKLFSKYVLKEVCNGRDEIDKKICEKLPFKKQTGEKFMPAEWLFTEGVYLNNKHFETGESTKYNYHFISPWLSKYFLGFYSDVAKHFRDYININGSSMINKVVISVGSAGELKFQSYNETRIAGNNLNCHYPNFGEPQFYGEIPLLYFRAWLKNFYSNDHTALTRLWNDSSLSQKDFDSISFPPPELFTKDLAPETGPYLASLYTFLNDTLKNHLDLMLIIHQKYFPKTRLVIKYPGVFWGPKDNFFTLQGLTGQLNFRDYFTYLKTSEPINNAPNGTIKDYDFKKAYKNAIASYLEVLNEYSNVELSYTAAEKMDGDDDKPENIPQTFFDIILAEAIKSGVLLNIENALEWNLPNKDLMNNLKSNFQKDGVADATLLRIQSLNKQEALDNIKKLLN